MNNVLFLHGGPGMSSEMERIRYKKDLPVVWWDQPRISAAVDQPFEHLVQAAEQQLFHLTSQTDSGVSLIASSFGVFLTDALIRRVRHSQIRSITISGGVLDLWTSFLRIGRRLAKICSNNDLLKATEEADKTRLLSAFWAMFGSISTTPGFFDTYWSTAAIEQRDVMQALLTSTSTDFFDQPTFQCIINDCLTHGRTLNVSAFRGPVRVIIGSFDLTAEKEDADLWRQVFPQASVQVEATGHFPHLELDPVLWMPE